MQSKKAALKDTQFPLYYFPRKSEMRFSSVSRENKSQIYPPTPTMKEPKKGT